MKKKQKKTQKDKNLEAIDAGIHLYKEHKIFGTCFVHIQIANSRITGKDGFALVEKQETICLNADKYLTPKEWAYVIAHNYLHLAFGHFDAEKMPGYESKKEKGKLVQYVECNYRLWNMACDIYVDKFLEEIKFGHSIHKNIAPVITGSLNNEISIYEELVEKQINPETNAFGTASIGACDMVGIENPEYHEENYRNTNTEEFSYALAESVSETINDSAGLTDGENTKIKQAANWFVSHYPLLGALAAGFEIIEDSKICQFNDVQIAAINVPEQKLFCNSSVRLSQEEWKFVLAHEYLHAGLLHQERCLGRDPYLWNVACDYVINGWLKELQIGEMPTVGVLYDENLKNQSVESIYDLLIQNIRQNSKLNTLRGYHKGDILGEKKESFHNSVTVDEFCRNAMRQGLEYHISSDRGWIPAGLIEEIKALSVPPIPWDVELAEWFDHYFVPLQKYHTYAKPSRRQSSTPDIPRPSYSYRKSDMDGRTFGVVIDTSGSMSASDIGKALGAVASYSVAHDVPYARVVFCDANAYDAGYISSEDIAGRVEVKGRGGTILQPAINLLEQTKDFPKDGPILIITDGAIENNLTIHREHAFLLTKGRRLPFKTNGKVFWM